MGTILSSLLFFQREYGDVTLSLFSSLLYITRACSESHERMHLLTCTTATFDCNNFHCQCSNTQLRLHGSFNSSNCDGKNGVNVSQKVGREVSLFLPDIWYICSYLSAVNPTDETESFFDLYLAEYLLYVQLIFTRAIRLVPLFLLPASIRQVVFTWSSGSQIADVHPLCIAC